MSGVIAASRVLQPIINFQAVNVDRFYSFVNFLGSLSVNLGNGDYISTFSTSDVDGGVIDYAYNAPYNGLITLSGNLNAVKRINVNAEGSGTLFFDIGEYGKFKNMEDIYLSYGSTYPTGDIGGLPKKCKTVQIITGAVEGDIAGLPPVAETVWFAAENTVSGNFLNAPASIIRISFHGNNTVVANIADFKQALKQFDQRSYYSSVTGSLADLKPGFDFFYVYNAALSNITGAIDNLPASMINFSIQCQNNISGDIATLPNGIYEFSCGGTNVISGDISLLPLSLVSFSCAGQNIITGDIGGLSDALRYLDLKGNNTVFGDIASLKSTIINLTITGQNTVTGNVGNIASMIEYLEIGGNNTLYGDLSSLNNIKGLSLYGNVSCHYTGTVWTRAINRFLYTPTVTGLITSEINQLLIDLSQNDWEGSKIIDLRGANAPRTSASNAAIITLQSKGVTILTN